MSTHPTLSVLPRYDGFSLANLPASLARIFDAPTQGMLPELSRDILPARITENTRNVILVLADGLGYAQLEAELSAGTTPRLQKALGSARGTLQKITSVFPSSTIPALTSLATGTPPGEHGLLGWILHLAELGGPTEVANWRPASRVGTYLDPAWGDRNGATFLVPENMHHRLSRNHVKCYAVGPRAFVGAPFTTMLYDACLYDPYKDPREAPAITQGILERLPPGNRSFVHVYIPNVDTEAHYHGPNSSQHRQAVSLVDSVIGELLEVIGSFPDTLLLLTADHGHIGLDPERTVHLNGLTKVFDELAVLPTGERRVLYFHPREGREEKLQAVLRETLGDHIEVFSSQELFDMKLFGPASPSREARRRAGGMVVLAKEEYQLLFSHLPSGLPPVHHGDHGGTTRYEMEIPLFMSKSSC